MRVCSSRTRAVAEDPTTEGQSPEAERTRPMSRNWSPQQNAIFAWFKKAVGHLIVRARAGTGKTTTILEAINHAMWAGKILLCAFNKVIADELAKRLTNPRAQARTLHSMGQYFCTKVWGKALKVDENRGKRLAAKAIGTDSVPTEIVKLVRDLASLGKNIKPFALPGELHQLAIEFQIIPPVYGHEDDWTVRDIAGAAHVAMQLATENDGCIDYDDMIWLPVRMKWAFAFFDLVVVDEAQDMNPTQLLLAKAMCRRTGHIVVVGDDRQAIYGFRGADSNALDNLKRELNAAELPLTITYRCPSKVVKIAKRIVPDFAAAPEAPEGIVDTINVGKLYNHVQPGNFVLSRSNAPLAKICLSLLRQGRKAVIRGRDIGKTLMAIVRRMEADSIPDLAQSIARWETNTIETMTKAEASESAIQYVIDQAATIIALCEGLANVSELESRLHELFSNNDVDHAVVCSSIHKAKGLETERVFLLVDTLYPGSNRPDYEESAEEANIEYVGVTRAKAHLTLVQGRP